MEKYDSWGFRSLLILAGVIIMCDILIFDTLEVPSDSPVIFIKQLLKRKKTLNIRDKFALQDCGSWTWNLPCWYSVQYNAKVWLSFCYLYEKHTHARWKLLQMNWNLVQEIMMRDLHNSIAIHNHNYFLKWVGREGDRIYSLLMCKIIPRNVLFCFVIRRNRWNRKHTFKNVHEHIRPRH